MINSMTAFGQAEARGNWGNAVLEIRTVNHRYLDINVRLPDELRMLEPVIREMVRKNINRGKVDCTLRFSPDDRGVPDLPVNLELAGKLIESARGLPIADPARLNPVDILRWPGVISREPPDVAVLDGPVRELLGKALASVVETRLREGRKLREMILERCTGMVRQTDAIKAVLPGVLPALMDRYRQRAQELLDELDEIRLEQELVLLTQKMDVAEELDRIEAHINEVKRVLEQDQPVGRRLDFLMQELNREANTLSSKSASIDTSNAAIELKVLIEQMREQVQNIE